MPPTERLAASSLAYRITAPIFDGASPLASGRRSQRPRAAEPHRIAGGAEAEDQEGPGVRPCGVSTIPVTVVVCAATGVASVSATNSKSFLNTPSPC
jgi:hypothetical protein